MAVQEKANMIIKEKELVIASERDSQIFYNAITNPTKPSDSLKRALADYETFVANSNQNNDWITKQKARPKQFWLWERAA